MTSRWLVTYRRRTDVCPLTYGKRRRPLVRAGDSVLDVVLQVVAHDGLSMSDVHRGALQFGTVPCAEGAA